MNDPRTDASPSPAVAAGIVVGMLLMIIVPAALTLHSVHAPGALEIKDPNPAPYGYTWSLLLFIVPIAAIFCWFLPSEGLDIPRRSFWRTILILVPLGFLLDFIFAQWFFTFPRAGATSGFPGWALGKPVPIEEYVFYFTGFVAVLLLYVWLSEYWLAAYSVPDYPAEAEGLRRLVRFHPTSLVIAIVLIGAAWFYKKHLALPENQAGFPGYLTVLVVGGMLPAMSFFPVAKRLINWRAFSLTMFFVLLISLLWEATLALPYGWWGFQSRQMTGLFIGAWYGLPIEEIGVWIAVAYATVIMFEIVKLWQASGRPMKEAMLGPKINA